MSMGRRKKQKSRSYDKKEKAQALLLYLRCKESYAEFVTKWRSKYGRHAQLPSINFLKKLLEKLENDGDFDRRRSRTVLSPEKIAEIGSAFDNCPTLSLRKAAQQLSCSVFSIWKTIRSELRLFPYKITRVQQLKEADKPQRVYFCNWFEQLTTEDQEVLDHFYFSDEANFHVNGHVNAQNARIWGAVNPRLSVQTPLYSPKTTVWCGISRKRIIGPFFFRQTVNQENYREMIQNCFLPSLHEADPDSLEFAYFQQDGATPHTAKRTMEFLREKFGDRLIAKGFWPPRSPDLTPPDFFLWGYLKSRVYSTSPSTLDELEERIREEIGKITKDMLAKVFRNLEMRVVECIKEGGGHFELKK